MNAFLFLVWSSWRNRVLSAVRRVRSPRYGAALVVGVLYIWGFLLRPVNSGAATPALLGQQTEAVVTLLMVLTLMGSWVFGADSTALAFTPAELSFLFPAPLSRRSLIRYKLFRAQVAVLINALIWVFVLRRGGGPLPSPLRAIALWMLFSTLNLHRLGAALVRSSWREHGATGVRRHRWSIAVFVLIGVAIAVSLAGSRQLLLSPSGVGAFFTTLSRAIATTPARWALWPFHAVVAPTFARTIGEWSRDLVPAAFVLGLHALWVLRTDAAFEDAAIEASAERARKLDAMRSRRSMAASVAPRKATASMPLAAGGPPAVAIFWKNMLCLRRTAQLRLFIGPLAMAIALGAAFANDGTGAPAMIARSATFLAGMLMVFGGRLIRNDLRQDMQHLPLLKTLPVSASELMLAEVASAALPMAAFQLLLLMIAFGASLFWPNAPIGGELRLGILLASPVAVLALNGALLTIQNGIAVLFPAWIRLGPSVTTGVEALGQNVLATVANLFSLALALIVPGLVAFTAAGVLHQPQAISIALVILVAAIVLAAETYGVLRALGSAFARAEPVT